jgi:hypothetical protein
MIEPHRSVVGQLARRTEKSLSIVIGHDEEQQRDYIAKAYSVVGFV